MRGTDGRKRATSKPARRTLIAVGIVAVGALVVSSIATRRTDADRTSALGSGESARSEPSRRAHANRAPPANASTSPTPQSARPAASAVFASWGSGKDQLGRERPEEGNPIGPMSVAVDRRGAIVILDQVNGRIVRRSADGAVEATIEVELRTPEDVAVADDGTIAVLDRHAGAQVAVYDPAGKLVGSLPLAGDGVPDTGLVTGVFVDGNDVYVERAHGPLVKVGDTRGNIAAERAQLAGRPTRDGESLLTAVITDKQAARVRVTSIIRKTGSIRFERDLQLWPVLRMILMLDSDAVGRIYLAAEAQPPNGAANVVMSCLDADTGDVIGGAVLPANTLPEESFRDFAVQDEGGVVYALRSESGVSYQRYTCER